MAKRKHTDTKENIKQRKERKKKKSKVESTASDDSDFEKPTKKKKPNKQAKKEILTSADLCEQWGFTDVNMEYTEAEYQNLTTYNLFVQQLRPLITEANPRVSTSRMASLLAAKWREFLEAKPKSDNSDSEKTVEEGYPSVDDTEKANSSMATEDSTIDSDYGEPPVLKKTPRIRIKIGAGPSSSGTRRSGRERRTRRENLKEEEILEDSDSEPEKRKKKKKKKAKGSDSEEEDEFKVYSESDVSISEEDEDDGGRRKKKKKQKKKRKQAESDSATDIEDENDSAKKKAVIPPERQSTRTRRTVKRSDAGTGFKVANMSEREFNSLMKGKRQLTSDSDSDEEVVKKPKKRPPPRPRGGNDNAGEKGSGDDDKDSTDHEYFCSICMDGGDLLLCDTCPRTYHKVCLKIDEIPEGDFICPECEDGGAHESWCKYCKDGGDLICCDTCPCVFHAKCLKPPMTTLPEGDWSCPRCTAPEVKYELSKILRWRWTEPSEAMKKDELDHTANSPMKKMNKYIGKEFYVKYKNKSYWHCEWLSEMTLEVYRTGQPLNRFMNSNDMSEPTPLEDGSSFGAKRHKHADTDVNNMEDKYYNCGIRPEWLQINRIIDTRKVDGKKEYLIKWMELGYEYATWETDKDAERLGFEDFAKFKEAYYSHRKANLKKKKKEEKKPKLKHLKKKMEKQPDYLDSTGGKLHNYQLEGLNWLRFSWAQGTDTILADEMGLGKTIQAITFIYSLWKEGYVNGPFLISAPLSTVANWEREFKFWAPDMYVVTYVGQQEARTTIRSHEISYEEGYMKSTKVPHKVKKGYKLKFDVLLSSYEMANIDITTLASIDWDILVVDEAHRLKKQSSLYFRNLASYNIKYRLLMTGTPLQNNLEELFNLLHFMTPDKFDDVEDFLSEFADISKDKQMKRLHEMLASHMLRRLKTDVLKEMPQKSECIVRVELAPMQKKYYKYILTRNFDALNVKGTKSQTSLQMIMMDLRKCCAHPYLFSSAEQSAPLTRGGMYEGKALIEACGKLDLLDKMLFKLKEQGHRVLIFSQMTRLLDILEDFLEYKQYGYERIDGSIMGNKRQEAIDRFNAVGSEQFVFLLSTKAGGLGINLATADTVIIYDMDWNPHNDIQAFSRAHRIGQTNKVMIYRFVTRNSVEERIAQVCKQKMVLTHLVIKPGALKGGLVEDGEESKSAASITKSELSDILKFGAEELFKDNAEGKVVYDDAALEKLLDRSQGAVEEKQLALDDYLSSFKVATYQVKEEDEEEDEEALAEQIRKKEEEERKKKEKEDPKFWDRVLRPSHQKHVEQVKKHEEEVAKTLGKGKRVRKQVNYKDTGRVNFSEMDKDSDDEEVESVKYLSDYNPSDSESEAENSSDSEVNFDSDTDMYKKKTTEERQRIQAAQKAAADAPMPPLLAKINGQTEVLGFTARQRRVFLEAVMKYGMPPEDPYNSKWLPRELKSKPEKVVRAYVSMFLRHLCEPTSDSAVNFNDGVPREGISRHHVLTRIGMMALVRRKVADFEKINGYVSIPYVMSRDLVKQYEKKKKDKQAKDEEEESKDNKEKDIKEVASKDDVKDEENEAKHNKDEDIKEVPSKDEVKDEEKEAKDNKEEDIKEVPSKDDVKGEEKEAKDKDGDNKEEPSKDEGKDVKDDEEKEMDDVDKKEDDDKKGKEDTKDEPMETEDKTNSADDKSNEADKNTKEDVKSDDIKRDDETGEAKEDMKTEVKMEEETSTDGDLKVKDESKEDSKDNEVKTESKEEIEIEDDEKSKETDTKKDSDETEEKAEESKDNDVKDEPEIKDEKKETKSEEKVESKKKEKDIQEIEEEEKMTPEEKEKHTLECLQRVFNIVEGGFTDLKKVWDNEERIMMRFPKDTQAQIWHRRHDYWLLAGVVVHGCAQWAAIWQDPRYQFLREPFRNMPDMSPYLQAKYLSRRFALLEHALIVEEHLFKAVRSAESGESTDTSSIQPADLEKIGALAKECMRVRNNPYQANAADAKYHRLNEQLTDLLTDMFRTKKSGPPSMYPPAKPKAPQGQVAKKLVQPSTHPLQRAPVPRLPQPLQVIPASKPVVDLTQSPAKATPAPPGNRENFSSQIAAIAAQAIEESKAKADKDAEKKEKKEPTGPGGPAPVNTSDSNPNVTNGNTRNTNEMEDTMDTLEKEAEEGALTKTTRSTDAAKEDVDEDGTARVAMKGDDFEVVCVSNSSDNDSDDDDDDESKKQAKDNSEEESKNADESKDSTSADTSKQSIDSITLDDSISKDASDDTKANSSKGNDSNIEAIDEDSLPSLDPESRDGSHRGPPNMNENTKQSIISNDDSIQYPTSNDVSFQDSNDVSLQNSNDVSLQDSNDVSLQDEADTSSNIKDNAEISNDSNISETKDDNNDDDDIIETSIIEAKSDEEHDSDEEEDDDDEDDNKDEEEIMEVETSSDVEKID